MRQSANLALFQASPSGQPRLDAIALPVLGCYLPPAPFGHNSAMNMDFQVGNSMLPKVPSADVALPQ